MFTIEDLSLGKCAVINDGTLEELREVLRSAFPKDEGIVCPNYEFYLVNRRNKTNWVYKNSTKLPTQSVKDFLTVELKRGDLVWVSDTDPNERDYIAIFISKVDGTKYPFICVDEGDEGLFRDGEIFNTGKYKYATKVEGVCMTVKEIEKALGITNLRVVK